jgi:hypothetical protein
MNFMTTERAIDFVATRLLSDLLENYGGDLWGAYPDVGEDDWNAALSRAKEIADDPGRQAYDMAYAHLKARSMAWEQEHG